MTTNKTDVSALRDKILKLKKDLNAIILAHNYQRAEVQDIADITGDSLELSRAAAKTDYKVIVFCGVHFMAESASILSPDKTVLLPEIAAGCPMADMVTVAGPRKTRREFYTDVLGIAFEFADDFTLRDMKKKHPGVPVVAYVNTSAAVKAESDICCTSSNAVEVVESLNSGRVIFLPAEFLGRYIAGQTKVDVILWRGHCEVHERFAATDLRLYREQYQDIQVLAHPECPPDVLAEADFVGSTSGMIRYVGQRRPTRVVMITECSMSDNVA